MAKGTKKPTPRILNCTVNGAAPRAPPARMEPQVRAAGRAPGAERREGEAVRTSRGLGAASLDWLHQNRPGYESRQRDPRAQARGRPPWRRRPRKDYPPVFALIP